MEVAEGLSHSPVSGALLKVLVDGVEWLRRALEGISGPRNSRRCKLTDIQDILTDYQVLDCVIFYFVYFVILKIYNYSYFILLNTRSGNTLGVNI